MQENIQHPQHPQNINIESSKTACIYFMTQMPHIENIENIENIEILQQSFKSFVQIIKNLIWQNTGAPHFKENIIFLWDEPSLNHSNTHHLLKILSDQFWLDELFLPNEILLDAFILKNKIKMYLDVDDQDKKIQPIILSSLQNFIHLEDIEKNIFDQIHILNLEHMETLIKLASPLTKTKIYQYISIDEETVQKGRLLYRQLKQQGFNLAHLANSNHSSNAMGA